MDSHGSTPPLQPPASRPGGDALSRSADDAVTRRRQTPFHFLERPDELFSWAVDDDRRGSCGATRDLGRATGQVFTAMATFSEMAAGSIRVARLDHKSRVPSYVYGRVLVRVWRDEDTGVIVVESDD